MCGLVSLCLLVGVAVVVIMGWCRVEVGVSRPHQNNYDR